MKPQYMLDHITTGMRPSWQVFEVDGGCAAGTFHHRRFSCADDMSMLSIFCWPVMTNARDFGLEDPQAVTG